MSSVYVGVVEWTWQIFQLPLACVLASVGIALVYYFAPDVDQHWTWLAPGTIGMQRQRMRDVQ